MRRISITIHDDEDIVDVTIVDGDKAIDRCDLGEALWAIAAVFGDIYRRNMSDRLFRMPFAKPLRDVNIDRIARGLLPLEST